MVESIRKVWMKWQASKKKEDLSKFETARKKAATTIRNARRKGETGALTKPLRKTSRDPSSVSLRVL